MRRKALALILALLAGGCAIRSTPTSGTTTTGTGGVGGVCQEDMACWNCETMGNKRCGPMINGVKAQRAAHEQLLRLGDGWQCWAEINLETPDGYEVICNQYEQPQPGTTEA